MADLVRYYKEYYRNQNAKSLNDLFSCMLDYDFASYHTDIRRVFAMWKEARHMGESTTVWTNGSSTGRAKSFSFGPHFALWKDKIERFLRLREKKTLMVVFFPGAKQHAEFRVSEVVDSSQKDFDLVGDWISTDHLSRLFDFVDSLYQVNGPVNLYTVPNIWMCLVTNPFFVSLSNQNRSKINAFVTSDFDSYFKRTGIYLRDQMIDWGSGLNFFDCEFGTRHFLPTFYYDRDCLSLINLRRTKASLDDLVEMDECRSLCSCGRFYIKSNMIFHFSNVIRDKSNNIVNIKNLLNNLFGHFANLQFHQDDKGLVSVFYSSVADFKLDLDLERIRVYFAEIGVKIHFWPDKYYVIGSKRYCSWRSSFVEPHDFLRHRRNDK